MANDLIFHDSAYPPATYPPGPDGLAFYIGGDTPHIWTVGEQKACPYRYRLPIFVRSNPADGATAAADVAAALAVLKEHGAPPGTLVAWDSETSVDPPYIAAVFLKLKAAGYVLIDYGSVSSVFGNDNPDGYYWGADWTSVPHLYPGTQITQYASLKLYDESEALPTLPLWDTAPLSRYDVTVPPPGHWQGAGVFLAQGTDGQQWQAVTHDGKTWAKPAKL